LKSQFRKVINHVEAPTSCARRSVSQIMEIVPASCAGRREGCAKCSARVTGLNVVDFVKKIVFVGYLNWILFCFKARQGNEEQPRGALPISSHLSGTTTGRWNYVRASTLIRTRANQWERPASFLPTYSVNAFPD
jgi:hypothetical protein